MRFFFGAFIFLPANTFQSLPNICHVSFYWNLGDCIDWKLFGNTLIVGREFEVVDVSDVERAPTSFDQLLHHISAAIVSCLNHH